MDHIKYLMESIEESKRARANGNTPFGAILVDKEGNIILRQQNIEITERDGTGHAETSLVRAATKKYDRDFLWECTLYSSGEPCAMCTGAIYWGNIGRIVYAISEEKILELTGDDPQNPTFSMPCREVLARGQKNIEVIGPFPELTEAVVEAHEGYWKKSN